MVVAIVVGIVDAVQAPAGGRSPRERRENWEARQLQAHGSRDREPWDD